ncbi:MAG: DUF5131 family protein [Anaerolineae bacterium]
MNKQKPPKGIEWTRIKLSADKIMPGYTWNPTGGCKHGCTWQMPDGSITECYAKTIAERFKTGFPEGFDAHYWREHQLEKPLKVKTPSGIFVGSMADLFGHWVPQEQILQVIDIMRQADWHIFQTLSKFPIRLTEFNPFPDNVWVGVSLPAGHMMSKTGAARALKAYLSHMTNVQAKVRFMSIEPLWFNVAPVLNDWLEEHDQLPFEWAIIGAASNGSTVYQPEIEWTQGLLDLFDKLSIPVFFKGNMDWNSNDWREDFPLDKVNIQLELA